MTRPARHHSLRVALLSAEMGRVQRGFERYFEDLFGVLRDRLDITLYRAKGPCSAGERVPFLAVPATTVARRLPLGNLAGQGDYKDYKRDCIAFGATIFPELLLRRFDVVHYIDPPLTPVLQRLGRACRLPSRVLFTEGVLAPPETYPRDAVIHHVGPSAMEDAAARGIPRDRMTFAPCGIHTGRFTPGDNRAELRRQYGIPESTFVVLVVSALRAHKRVGHAVEEMAQLGGDALLWIDGEPSDPAIAQHAREELGPRCRITHVPSDAVLDLYRLADVLIHPSLTESFGLAIVEAMCAGLPVRVHDSPHFKWLVEDRECLVDMAGAGALAASLRALRAAMGPARALARGTAGRVRERFDWANVAPAYARMYHQVAASGAPRLAGRQEVARG